MEKIINFLNGQKNITGSPAVVNFPSLIKNTALFIIALTATAFTAGTWLSNAKDLPRRVAELERKQILAESEYKNINGKLSDISAQLTIIQGVLMGK